MISYPIVFADHFRKNVHKNVHEEVWWYTQWNEYFQTIFKTILCTILCTEPPFYVSMPLQKLWNPLIIKGFQNVEHRRLELPKIALRLCFQVCFCGQILQFTRYYIVNTYQYSNKSFAQTQILSYLLILHLPHSGYLQSNVKRYATRLLRHT